MGLKMSEKKALTREVCARYRRASRKEKTAILDEFVKTTEYNRKYAVRVLGRYGKTATVTLGGKTVKVKAAAKPRPRNRRGKVVYGTEVIDRLRDIWKLSWYKCGKYLALMMREQMPYLAASRDPDLHLTAEIVAKLLKISPATIDRVLKADKDALRGKGISGTKLGDQALLKQLPIRTHYSEQERNTPGYFQTDTVHHCGESEAGEFNLSLTATDVCTGWTELRPLKNKAHRWTLEGLQDIYAALPFTMLEMHSDNGSEFINKDTIDWWKLVKTLSFTHSRSHHKNDNCYAEQKNNAFVRNYAGYYRFDTDAELAALGTLYHYLCPLINFFIPNKRLISKTVVGSKTVKKYDSPKTPYQRLLESSISDDDKAKLTATRALYNPVTLQHNVRKSVAALLAAHRAKVTFSI